MVNRQYQSMALQMKEASSRNIGVLDENGTVIASSELSFIGETISDCAESTRMSGGVFKNNGYTYLLAGQNGENDGIIFVEGVDDAAERFAAMVRVTFESVKQFYDDKFDKGNFVKNVVLDNILQGDIYIKARDLHFTIEATRVVMLVRTGPSKNISAYEVISGLFTDKQKDFVFNISESDTVIVKELPEDIELGDIEKLANSIVDILENEHYVKAVVGIGSTVVGIKELANSFKDAQVALEVGKVFDTERPILSYDNLGIARLIYQLPTTLCEMFLREIFKKGSIDTLDQETLFTIQRFFENNLNVSETSRGLFVHRNTLVYRIEKIKKLTGLDLREFDHAIVFKVALMVKKYLDSNPAKY